MESVFGGTCVNTVSILHWAIFGAEEACIDISMQSVIVAVVAFLVGVTALQLVARRLWRNRRGIVRFIIAIPFLLTALFRRKPSNSDAERPSETAEDQPIRSSRF